MNLQDENHPSIQMVTWFICFNGQGIIVIFGQRFLINLSDISKFDSNYLNLKILLTFIFLLFKQICGILKLDLIV